MKCRTIWRCLRSFDLKMAPDQTLNAIQPDEDARADVRVRDEAAYAVYQRRERE